MPKALEVRFDRGVYLPELDLWLDSLRRRDFGLISHAHSDHTARHSQPVLSRNTGLLLSDYLKKSSPILLDYREPLEMEKYTLTLYPAGHCLGSAQALVTSKASGTRLLYTGDFKAQTSPTNEPLEPVSCDVLVLEATYGMPEYNFPPQKQVLSAAYQILRSWISKGEKPVVQLWRLGKSQEVLHLLLGEGFDVVVDDRVYAVARIYEDGGVTFPGRLHPYDGHWAEGQVLICPPGKSGRAMLSGVRGLRYMELTGWAAGAATSGYAEGGSSWFRRILGVAFGFMICFATTTAADATLAAAQTDAAAAGATIGAGIGYLCRFQWNVRCG